MSAKRNLKVADLIRREVALLLKATINDPRLTQMMITTVDLSPDLKNADIYYTLPDEVNREDVAIALIKATGFIRHELATRLTLRYVPQISFCYDDSIARAQHLLSLINKVE